MMKRHLLAAVSGGFAFAAMLHAHPALAESLDCNGLAGKSFAGGMVIETDEVASPMTINTGPRSGLAVKAPFCRVRGVLKPGVNSEIIFEVWLPPKSAWNGKYEGVGNGGFGGALNLGGLYQGVLAGYAVSSTDVGHVGGDTSFVKSGNDRIMDWGWRAIHLTAVASKALTEAYYGTAPSRTYFAGCSYGGRQALIEAQRFPNDYNGIIAGSPTNYGPQLEMTELWTYKAITADAASWVSPDKLALVNKAALANCGGINGVMNNPGQCRFDPVVLRCRAGQKGDCLTAAEVITIQKIYSGALDKSGKSIFPGFARGGEISWSRWLMGPQDKPGVGASNYREVESFLTLLNKKEEDLRISSDGYEHMIDRYDPMFLDALLAGNPDLSAFKAAGGKLIQYHGWTDASVPPGGSVKYYEAVLDKMGGDNAKSFYRLFMAPGMDHCGGGDGPNVVGGPGRPAPSRDPEHDMLAALDLWVEKGRAPEQITATLYRDNDPAKGIAAQRPWCAYPRTAKYSGNGDISQAANFTCVAP